MNKKVTVNLAVITCLIFSFNQVLSLNSNDYCLRTQHVCKGTYTYGFKYIQACTLMDCAGKYSYACQKRFCSTSKQACYSMTKIGYLINSLTSSHLHFMQSKQLEIFKKNFKNCAYVKHKINPIEVCMNSKSCFINSKLVLCPCFGEHGFHCGLDYCTSDSITCNSIKNKFLAAPANFTAFEKCGNENTFYKDYMKPF